VEVEWLDALYRGMSALARDHGVNLLGGDTTASRSDLVINIALTGLVPREQVLFRHTAHAGDLVVLTGLTGESGAGCEILLKKPTLPDEICRRLVRAHLEPRPHLEEGRLLATSGACTAAIDVSDGVSSDLGHLCGDSGLGALVYEAKIPTSDDLIAAGAAMAKNPLDWVLHGGEDYVLLAAINPNSLETLSELFRSKGLTLVPIGEFVPGSTMVLRRIDGSSVVVTSGGWDHFR
jgi:thiamine-monophosphate kinase